MLLEQKFIAFETRAREAAVIGDNFVLPEKFQQAIRDACEEALEISTMCLPFPDESMEHGIDGLQEYQGDPKE
jgi:hypothetical protein